MRALISACFGVLWLAATGGAAQTIPTGISPATETPAVAIFRGEAVRQADLDAYWRDHEPYSFRVLQEQLAAGRERMLDRWIADRLLTVEAGRLHTTVDRLLEALPVPEPTEADVARLYAQSSAQAQGLPLDLARPSIEQYLRRQLAEEARTAFTDRLRRSASGDLAILLDVEHQTIPVQADDPVWGAASAVVSVVEFSDFECPYCAQAAPILRNVVDKYAGRVKLVWKDMPSPAHVSAIPAAQAARCAGEQNQFWAYHDALFAHQQQLTRTDFARYARDVGLDEAVFKRCLATERYQSQLSAAMHWAVDRGISSTPTVFINGRPITGVASAGAYERVIEQELERLTGGPRTK